MKTLISKRRLASLASASVMIATVAVAAAPAATLAAATPSQNFLNGFEKAVTSDNQTVTNVTRVTSGTSGIKAASGRWYATADMDAYAFTRFGGYSSAFPTHGYKTSVDIYLDMSKSVGIDQRFDWSSAINTPNVVHTHRRDFAFNVGTVPANPGQFLVSVSTGAPGDPSTGPAPLTISKSGWYTFQHTFKNVDGKLVVDLRVIGAKGSVLRTWTLSDPTDIIGDTIGGNRYGWLVSNDFAGLALDNVTLVRN